MQGIGSGRLLQIVILALVVFTLYIILFDPNLSQSALNVVKPVVYVGEAVIFFGALYLINGLNLGDSDLSIWVIGILSVISIIFGVIFFFFSGFVPNYLGVTALFGVILVVLGGFMAFRARRRHGQFVYLR